jgi:hypothetical protein
MVEHALLLLAARKQIPLPRPFPDMVVVRTTRAGVMETGGKGPSVTMRATTIIMTAQHAQSPKQQTSHRTDRGLVNIP